MRFRLFGRVYTLSVKVCVIGIIGALALVAAVGRFLFLKSADDGLSPVFPDTTPVPSWNAVDGSSTPDAVTPSPPVMLAVHISGAVVSEGVYWVTSGTILADVIEYAGGLSAESDTSSVNLALRVKDGMHIHIPTVGSAETGWLLDAGTPTVTPSEEQRHMKVNINTASLEELMTLSGVGESTAKDIIQYRTDNGPFASIEDIMLVSGIKEARFAKFKGQITVG